MQAPPCSPRSVRHAPRDGGETGSSCVGAHAAALPVCGRAAGTGRRWQPAGPADPGRPERPGPPTPALLWGTVLALPFPRACLTLPCLLATFSGGHGGSMMGRPAGGESSPSQALMQSPGRPGRGPGDIPPPHGCLVSPIRSCPSACHLCAPVLWVPPLVCEAPTSRGGTASEGPASGGFWDLQKWC